MSRSWGKGSTRAWRQTRAMVLSRDNFQCRAHSDGWCDRANRSTPHTCTIRAELTGPHAGHAHHTGGKAQGDDPRYIVAACKTCNLHIGNPATAADPKPKPRTRWT